MNKTYLFYDLETTGINKCFDQILQFAAIRTDESLNELERHEFLVKLNPDTIPTPKASITHHISIEKANTGICEYEAVKKIFQLINTPNTISIGYNTLGFDDEMLRFSFYKNLFPAYDHQYKNGCQRADLYPIVSAYFLFADEVLDWPVNEKQKVSLKLEDLNSKNSLFLQGRAHDAMTDVVVTVELAKRLKKHHEKMWVYLMQKFDKAEDQKSLSLLDKGLEVDGQSYTQGIMVSGSFGYDAQFMAPVINLGQHWHYKNQWCFLRLDSENLPQIMADNQPEMLWSINKKWGDLPLLLPAKKRFAAKLSAQRIKLIQSNKQWFQENPHFFIEAREAILDYKYPQIENIDIDAALYQAGFMNAAQQKLCDQFHKSDIAQKITLMQEMPSDYYQRALRVIGRFASECLPPKMQQEFQQHLEMVANFGDMDRVVDYKGQPRISLPDAYEQIQQLRLESHLTDEQNFLLDELENYLSS
ncbi:exodeoxyribonuclease I [Facilibium subflavum]|uniref:exodeoxyribonuclease I n=1 Tax=Facilibium subflavum TaxID=2219058 RepID=UPI000E64B8D4|nr:exodeoxyribonuclease I [Facilibium subflavum]